MLDFDNPALHHHSWSASCSHANHKPQPYYPTSPNSMHQSDCPSPRLSSFQSKTTRLPSSPSFVPSPRPEQLEPVASQTRRSAAENGFRPASPFRSVRRMKKPFELKLPASPRSSSEKESWSPPPSRERGLRPWRSDQNLAATRLESSGLLPSPPLSASPLSNPSPTSTCFLPRTRHDPAHDQTAEDCDYGPPSEPCNYATSPRGERDELAERQPGEFTDVHMPRPSRPQYHEPNSFHCSPGGTGSDHVPFAANASFIGENVELNHPDSERRAREATVSSDAGFIPNNLSYFETWLQGVPGEVMDVDSDNSRNGLSNRRKFQIVQKCPSPLEETGEPVTFAVASKTKPKLVDISPKSSPPMSYSDPNQSPRHPLPSIPDQHQEISSFSPDTSNEPVDGFRDTYFSYYSSDENDAVEYMDTGSIHSDSMSSTAVCETSILDHESHDRAYSPAKPDFGPTIIPPHKPRPSPGGMECMTDREQLEKWWDHEWTLDQLEYSVKDFPRNMLRLTSPVIMFLRHNSEQALLRPFRKIFPDISENLLDSLSAGLIAWNYVVSLSSNQRSTGFLSDSSLYGVSIVPDKALTTLGIHVPRVSQTQVRDRIFGSRSAELRKNLDKIVDYLLFAICGRSDETLKSAVMVVTQVLEANA